MIALTRAVSPRIAECELSFMDWEPIDAARAAAEHDRYESCLEQLGLSVVHIDGAPEHPDGVFVEDAAIVLDEIAIITRPGADSRRGETTSVARVLERYRPLRFVEAPATIDGGDVLRAGRTLFVGLSQRTNEAAIGQLRALAPGYEIVPVAFRGCLHLKSAVTQLDARTMILNPDWVDPIEGFETVEIDPDEPFAANVLRIGERLLIGAGHSRTRRRLEERGHDVIAVDVSELAKAEAGVTCCSLIV